MISVRKWFIASTLLMHLHPLVGETKGGEVTDGKTNEAGNGKTNEAGNGNAHGAGDASGGDKSQLSDSESFIAPDEFRSVDDVDVFVHDHQHEYLVIDRDLTWFEANVTCMRLFNARLADFENSEKLGPWMAEALSETDLKVDSLWTSGTWQEGDSKWYWGIRHNKQVEISKDLEEQFSHVKDIEANDRLCVAFARLDHDMPHYRKLTCQAKRGALCVRAEGGGHGNSTHPGWIKLGSRHYKIFGGPITYDEADRQCYRASEDAQLAVIRNFKVSQFLGRYLLVGRPSLENAWIGARWKSSDKAYVFEAETLVLTEKSHEIKAGEVVVGRWPPWRQVGGKDRNLKPNGCLLLDRHLANQTLFVEARCERKRGYICYRMAIADGSKNDSTDVIIGTFGYRLHYAMKTWYVAKAICDNYTNGKGLVEVDSKEIKNHLLYIMGENRTAMQHLWIGGQFDNKEAKWKWVYSKTEVPKEGDGSVLDWVVNDTYNAEVESDNICLNMDRENHIHGLFYGTRCNALQMFICKFEKDDLKTMIQEEKKELGLSAFDYLDGNDGTSG